MPAGRGAGTSGPVQDPAEGDRPPDLPASQADQRQGLTQRSGPDHDEREDVDIAPPRR